MIARRSSRRRPAWFAAAALLIGLACAPARAQTGPPITLGFSMALTGALAANGKAALVAYQIWEREQNGKGGLLGRPVKLVYYDDQSNPANVPGIYTKLIDVDRVDILMSSYGTNLSSPALPLAMREGRVLFGLLGFGVNEQFNYENYFAMAPFGPSTRDAFKGFVDLAMAQTPRPSTIAIVAADAEFAKRSADAARENARAAGLRIVYDRSYPPTTTDFTAVMRGVQTANADVVFVASYPPDSAGLIRAAHEIGLAPKLFGGTMVGPQYAALKTQLGPLLNGIVTYEFYVPEPSLRLPGMAAFLQSYQAAAEQAGVDPLGFYVPPYAYAEMQVIAAAMEATRGVAQDALAAYLRGHEFGTIVGPVRFAPNGEWAAGRLLWVQYQGVQGNGIDQFRRAGTQVIVLPDEMKSGRLIYPYADAQR